MDDDDDDHSFPPLEEIQLWRAADEGDLETIQRLLEANPDLDVNWLEVDSKTTPLAKACLKGHLEAVRYLLAHPRINVNQRILQDVTPLVLSLHGGNPQVTKLLLDDPRSELEFTGFSVFYVACAIGSVQFVKVMMNHHRVEVDGGDECGATPFLVACGKNHTEVVKMLLMDPRVNRNAVMTDGQTAVSLAVEIDAMEILASLIALGGNDLETRHPINVEESVRMELPEDWKQLLKSFGKPHVLPREVAEAKGHRSSLALLDLYEMAPNETRYVLWRRIGVQGIIAAEIFCLIIFLCDHYLTIKATEFNPKARRFLSIVQRLPIEIQMTLCNRVVGLCKDLIPKDESDAAFKRFAWKEMLSKAKQQP